MFEPQDYYNYEAAAHKAMSVLANMRVELDAYKLREKASEIFIKKREEIIELLQGYVDVCMNTFDRMSRDRERQYHRGYDDAVIKYTVYGGHDRNDPNNKEKIRATSILNAMESQPHLY